MKIYRSILSKKICFEQQQMKDLKFQLANARKELHTNVSQIYFFLCLKNVVNCMAKVLHNKKIGQNKKLSTLLQVSSSCNFDLNNTVKNLSNHELSTEEHNALKFGLNHGILTPLDERLIKSKFEELYARLTFKKMIDPEDSNIKEKLYSIAARYIKQNRHNSKRKVEILTNLQKKNLKICKFDKGNGVVILNECDYNEKLMEILDTPMFKKSNLRKGYKPPNIKDEETLKSIIDSIPSSETSVIIDEVRKTYLKGCLPAKLYGLPKVHKNGIPMRPVLSTIGSANHKISKVLDKFLQLFTVMMCLSLLRK